MGCGKITLMKRHATPLIFAFFSILLAVVSACTLTTKNDLPPTIVPRATDTALPTIAYATLSPQQLPQPQQQAISPAVGGNLTSLLSLVESDRMYLNIDALQRFQTRHVNSPNLPDSGINAAYHYIHTQLEKIQAEANGNFQVFDQSFPLKWSGLDTVQNNIVGLIGGQAIG